MFIARDLALYRQYLPHYRTPGSIYHCRFSLNPAHPEFNLTQDWMFEAVEDAIFKDHKKECLIYAYVIMANHAHVVVQPLPRANNPCSWCDQQEFYRLEIIVGKIKGRSSRQINSESGLSGSLWQSESYDRTIRNECDLENTIDYLHHNPVRWGLVDSPQKYRWSSMRTIYSGEGKYRGWFDIKYTSAK